VIKSGFIDQKVVLAARPFAYGGATIAYSGQAAPYLFPVEQVCHAACPLKVERNRILQERDRRVKPTSYG
jgi:hypothetical protein